jgi:hypothetical protein
MGEIQSLNGEPLPAPFVIIEAFLMQHPSDGREGICVSVVSLDMGRSVSTARWMPLPLLSHEEWELGMELEPVDLDEALERRIESIAEQARWKATGKEGRS